MRRLAKLDEVMEHIDLPDPMFQFCVDTMTGEVTMPDFDPTGQVPTHELLLPTLTEVQIDGWMASFACSHGDERLRGVLLEALRHPAPARRFQEVLSVNPGATRQWEAFAADQRRQIALAWLRSHGVECI